MSSAFYTTPHATATQLFHNAVVRNGLPDKGLGICHLPLLLGCSIGRVNARPSIQLASDFLA
jgi:hypothetical protein